MSELDQLRQEAEQLKNQIRVCISPVGLEVYRKDVCVLKMAKMDSNVMHYAFFHSVRVNVMKFAYMHLYTSKSTTWIRLDSIKMNGY